MLSYDDLATLREKMLSRCLVAVQKYAVYVSNEAGNTANHANRIIWAKKALADPRNYATQTVPYVMGNQDFLDQGGGLTDSELQSIVETTLIAIAIDPA